MKTTYFKPSIHGWPFYNSFRYSVLFDKVTLNMGFCGGMCWTALDRFYSGTCIPRDTQAPSQGDALYNEIFNEQIVSLMTGQIWKIYEWQQSPDLGHRLNPHHSLGHKTQSEWRTVKQFLDNSYPCTLTLIASSNDYNPAHLMNNHRVVAYAYEERPLQDGEWVHGNRNSNILQVTIFIYDPNYPDSDDIRLTFYTGCDDSWIHLRHSMGDEYHGFFLDDNSRSYASVDSTAVWINRCVQTGINSATQADYDVQFSWKCRFIPYFCIRVDGINWQYNILAKANYLPDADKDNKQCPTRVGSITISLKLPRDRSTVSVRLLDTDDYCQSCEVDARPAIDCYPYIRKRAAADYGPQVCDTAITDADLFIKDPQPTQAAVQQVDTSPFRWIILVSPRVTDTRETRDDLSRAYVEVFDSYRLGNIAVPVLANFVERNLAAPTLTSGVVTVMRGQMVQTINLTTLTLQAQKIFDGFTDNPADYDNDTTVEFIYKSIDRFGVVAQGRVVFYGRSIIYHHFSVILHMFDWKQVAKLEAVARELIERGLIDLAIELPHVGGLGYTPFQPQPQPRPIDPVALIGKLRSHRKLQGLIDQMLEGLWSNTDIWKEIWKVQSEIVKQADRGRAILIKKPAKTGEALKVAHKCKGAEQLKYDAVIINTFAQKAIEQLRQNPTVIDKLKSL